MSVDKIFIISLSALIITMGISMIYETKRINDIAEKCIETGKEFINIKNKIIECREINSSELNISK